MLFNNQIKKHWLEKIEELGHRFNPDCGSSEPSWELGDTSPFNLLTDVYDNSTWGLYEREFQLPRWILSALSDHMHYTSPKTSKEDMVKVFNACDTYVDLEILKHSFFSKICLYLIKNFSDVKAQLSDDFFGPVWVNLLAMHKQMLSGNTENIIKLITDAKLNELKFECFAMSDYEYFGYTYEGLTEEYASGWQEYFFKLHGIRGDKIEREKCGWIVFNMLIDTLEGK